MEVIIFADRKGQELLPLTDNTCIPLLPVAGKLVLEHTIEALVDAQLRQAHIILSPFSEQVKEIIGSGARWGLNLTYSTSRGEQSTRQEIAKLQNPPTAPFLIIRGDIIRSGSLNDFLHQSQLLTARCVQALYNQNNAYMLLCRDSMNEDIETINWLDSSQQALAKTSVNLSGIVAKMDSLPAFHQANLDAAAGRLETLLIPGRHTALGLKQGRNTEAYPQNVKQGIALIGANCRLHPSVELSGEVVIGDNVIIDSRVTIESSVILPHSYIGELVELRNAIVRGNDLIRVDNGAILKITDTFLLADLKITYINKGLSTLINRLAGLLLLILSCPFWLLAFSLSLIQNPSKYYLTTPLRGNKMELNEVGFPQRTQFNAGEWNVSAPVLRYLPRIIAVINGDLSLIGSLPISIESASKRLEEWERLADQSPSGLLGPTQLNIPADASEEEKIMSDSFYAMHFSFSSNAGYLWQSIQVLFSRKAWISSCLKGEI